MPAIDGRRSSSDAIGEVAVTDPTTDASLISLLKGLLSQLQGSGTGSSPVSLSTLISSDIGDNIDVSKMTKGAVETPHNGINSTTTSSELDCRGFNTISLECTISGISGGSWIASLTGCSVSGGTFGNCFTPKDDGTFAQQKTPTLNANGNTTYYFRGIPNYLKIVATETGNGGNLTCKVTPMNL